MCVGCRCRASRKSSKERVVEPREGLLMSFDREVGCERYVRGVVVVVVMNEEGTGERIPKEARR